MPIEPFSKRRSDHARSNAEGLARRASHRYRRHAGVPQGRPGAMRDSAIAIVAPVVGSSNVSGSTSVVGVKRASDASSSGIAPAPGSTLGCLPIRLSLACRTARPGGAAFVTQLRVSSS